MAPAYLSPVPLASGHLVEGFVCRSDEQARWLVRHSRQSMAMGLTRVFVVTPVDEATVVAYYAWTMAQVNGGAATSRFQKGAGRYPQPVALLARLGVHRDHEGHGLGAALLRDVLLRLVEVGQERLAKVLLEHIQILMPTLVVMAVMD